MATIPASNLDKAAVLLRRLPPPSLTKVLEMIGAENSIILQKAINAVASRTDLAELDDLVLQEFRDMQRDVKESLRGSPQLERVHANNATTADSPQLAPQREVDNSAVASLDPIADLQKTPPAILAAVLQKETIRAASLVLRELPTEFTGQVLELLPAESRQQIFMLLAMKSLVHPAVTDRVLRAALSACKNVDLTVENEEQGRFKTLIGILQMVEREERLRLMEALSEQDEELAAQIDDSLYDYADILRIQDRSVQKLLTQLELKVVALALKTAPQEIVDKVVSNLSERVRATLAEEMELLSSVTAAKVDQARKEIANIIRLQDKDGTLQWIE